MIDSAQLRRISTACGNEDLIMTPAMIETAKAIWAEATREERERCLAQVDREKGTWHFTSTSRAVRTACDNIKAMIRGEK